MAHGARLMAACAALAVGVACANGQKTAYTTHVLTSGLIAETINATGEVTARTKVNIGSQVSGIIAEVKVDFNDVVAAGDVLACVAPQVFEAQAARASASLAVAHADLERAELELRDSLRTQKRHATLGQGQMLSAAEVDKSDVALDAAGANLKKAQAGVMQAKADSAQARANLALTQIRSPIDGVVLDRQVEVGQTVAAQFQVATLFVIVGDMRAVRVIVNIDEADVGHIKAGMPATFHVDAYPQMRFTGVLHSLRRAPSGLSQQPPNNSGVVTYAAIIEADNPNELLLQGMTAQAEIEKAHVEDAVQLPLAALRFVPKGQPQAGPGPHTMVAGSSGTVYVLEAGAPKKRQVQLGLSDGRFVQVTLGLSPGERVIVGESDSARASSGTKGMRRGRG